MEWSKIVYSLLLSFCVQIGYTQDVYFFAQFKDKNCLLSPCEFLSSKSLKRRERQKIKIQASDFPVSSNYFTSVSAIDGVEIIMTSKWLNGVLVKCDKRLLDSLLKQEYVASLQCVGSAINLQSNKNALLQTHTTPSLDYGKSLAQIQNLDVDKMHDAGFNGKGMYIAIFDGGFQNANQVTSLHPLFQQNRVKFMYNIVDGDSNVFVRDLHGTNVLSCLAAYSPGNLIGTGYGADFALFISEDVKSEKLIEEYNWLRAAEMADSLGIDIISSSLGYNTFDNSADNHTLSQLDGHTTVITKAAQMAAQKGIVVVNSAGNNYNDTSWPKIVFSCDADSILAVGAVDASGNKASFSAIGPTADGRIKPDVSALGVNVVVNNTGNNFITASGTSYSTPLVAGLVAGLWQADTSLTNVQVMNYVKQSSSIYCTPNNEIGYGVPNFSLAYQLITDKEQRNCSPNSVDYYLYPNPVYDLLNFKLNGSTSDDEKKYQLLDVQGREMMQGQISNSNNLNLNLDLSGLNTGVYFLIINQKSYKLVKL